MMMKHWTMIVCVISTLGYAQIPPVEFNHAYIVLDSSDYRAVTGSQFIQNEFSGFFTLATATRTASWTGAYLFGDINYIELFGPSGSQHAAGDAAMALSFDRSGDIQKMQSVLDQKYGTELTVNQRNVNGSFVPWFHSLSIRDSSFFIRSHIGLWMMEYTKEYFAANHFPSADGSVTRKDYLLQHEEKRKNKYLQRFTGITFYASDDEIHFYTALLAACGFFHPSADTFVSPEGFTVAFERRNSGCPYAVKSLQFTTAVSVSKNVDVSDHIRIRMSGQSGEMIFH